jgi:hypothetical protein
MAKAAKDSPGVRGRAVRIALEPRDHYESGWVAMGSIVAKIDCTMKTLREWVWQGERDVGRRCARNLG